MRNDPVYATGCAQLQLERFDYAPLNQKWAVVRLLAGVAPELRPPAGASLLVQRDKQTTSHAAFASTTERAVVDAALSPSALPAGGESLLWRASFAVPLELIEYPRALFELTSSDRIALALPTPDLRAIVVPQAEDLCARRPQLGYVRRRIVALATSIAVTTASTGVLGIATATADHGAMTATMPKPRPKSGNRANSQSPVNVPGATNASILRKAPAAVLTDAPAGSATPTSHAKHAKPAKPGAPTTQTDSPIKDSAAKAKTPAGTTHLHTTNAPASPAAPPTTNAPAKTNAPATTNAPAKTKTNAPAKPTAPSSPKAPAQPQPQPQAPVVHHDHTTTPVHPKSPYPFDNVDPGHALGGAPKGLPTGGAGVGGVSSNHSDHPPKPTPAPASPPPASPDTEVAEAPSSSLSAGLNANPAPGIMFGKFSGLFASVDQPPPFLIPIYKKAGHRYHVPWRILAAINWIETDFGRNLNISSAGAIGWMQFMPATWAAYGVDADGKGKPNPYDPHDAIFAAARYLAANGARHDLRGAIFAYNHATWYVNEVMWKALVISDHAFNIHNTKGYALPLDARYMHTLGRTDDGLDIETAPDGAAVYSITPGIVTAVASNPGGFGPNYPVILVTAGPLAGQYIYYGHVAASLVKVGQHVLAGQPIAVMGHTGDAASLGHGHIEIGFSDGTGNPLNHHGATAWTTSGDAMRRFLIQLSSSFGIKNS